MAITENEWIIKQRKYYNPRSWQLVREGYAYRYAHRALPSQIHGVSIVVPENTLFFTKSGIEIRSRRYQGEMQMVGLYRPEMAAQAIRMGVYTLQALSAVQIVSNPFKIWSLLYQPIRTIKVWRKIQQDRHVFTNQQIQRFISILRIPANPRKVKKLTHGNLHGGNILVDYLNNELAIIDLEMMHIGNPVVDFAALWVTHYLASPPLAEQFLGNMEEVFPEYSKPGFIMEAYREIMIEAYLMLHKARRSGNVNFIHESENLIHEILNCPDPLQFLSCASNPK